MENPPHFTSIKQVRTALNIQVVCSRKQQKEIIDILNGKFEPDMTQNTCFLNFYVGLYYQKIKKDGNKMLEYYRYVSCKCNNISLKIAVYLNTADYYFDENNIKSAMSFLIYAAKLNSSIAFNRLAIIYRNDNNFEFMKRCYIKAIVLNDNYSMRMLAKYTEKVELFVILNKITHKNKIIDLELTKLRKTKAVNQYINKLNFAKEHNIVKECPICYETKLSICVDNCMHTVCEDCYTKITKCPFCR